MEQIATVTKNYCKVQIAAVAENYCNGGWVSYHHKYITRKGWLMKKVINAVQILRSKLERHYARIKYKKWLYPETLPETIRIDATTICQLRCEGCGFQKSGHRGLGGGFLKADDFEKILDENPQIKRVELSNYGEIFLNPELISIMKCANEHSVKLEAAMGVNFNRVTSEQLEALVKYRFSFISISIDGASQQSYEKYRIGGNFDTVIENIKKLQTIKKKYGSEYLKLSWQFILNQYDEEDIPEAKKLAKELGIPIVFKLNFLSSYTPVHEQMIREETGLDCITRKEYMEKHNMPYLNDDCLQMFLDPQFNYDGALLGCCRVEEDCFDANIFRDGLKQALQAPKFVKAKEMLLHKHPEKRLYSDLPCWNCSLRKTRMKYGKKLVLPKE